LRDLIRQVKSINVLLSPVISQPHIRLLVVSVHVEWHSNESDLVSLKGAHSGDQICVTGDLGGAVAGLHVLLREKKEWQESGKGFFSAGSAGI
jgi:hypothetical protein